MGFMGEGCAKCGRRFNYLPRDERICEECLEKAYLSAAENFNYILREWEKYWTRYSKDDMRKNRDKMYERVLAYCAKKHSGYSSNCLYTLNRKRVKELAESLRVVEAI